MRKVTISSLAVLALSVLARPASAYVFDSQVPQEIQTQIRNDLEFMNTVQGQKASDLHQQIFGEISGAAYRSFFETRITRIGLNACGGGSAVACVIPLRGSDRMYITQNYIRFSHPAIARLMVVYHEARHSEVRNGNWSHAVCPTPFLGQHGEEMRSIWTGAPLAGEPACDSTPFGSYGSSTILLKNISKKCTNCTDKVKLDAGIYADDQVKRVTNPDAKARILKDIF